MKLYFDYASQPSRALLIYCRISSIPIQLQEIRLIKGQHLTPQFKKLSMFAKVPLLKDDQFCLAESHTIARYLCEKCKPENTLFHKDLQKNSRINMYLDFHHSETRKIAIWLYKKVFAPMMGKKFSEEVVEDARDNAQKALSFIDKTYLKQDLYLANNEFSFADISAYCEIMQLKMIDYNFEQYPRLSAWMERIGKVAEVDEINKIFFERINAFKKSAPSP